MTTKFPTCPEICQSCKEGDHILHIEEELASIHVSPSDKGRGFLIRGFGENDSEHFWLKHILQQAAKAVGESDDHQNNGSST